MTQPLAQSLTLAAAFQQATRHHQAGQLAEAEQLYRAILLAHPQHADTNHKLGLLASQVGQHAAGLPFLKVAFAANPANVPYLQAYIEALLGAGLPDDALVQVKKAMSRGLNTPAMRALKKAAEAAHGQRPTQPSAEAVGQLIALFTNQCFADAESMATGLIAQYPDAGVVWKVLGAALQEQSKPALVALQKAVDLQPNDAQTYCNLGISQQRDGLLTSAEGSYQRAVVLNPQYAEAFSNLGCTQLGLRKFEAAAANSRQAIALQPNLAQAYNNLGSALRELGFAQEALASFERAVVLKPDMVEALINIGLMLIDLQQFNSAMVRFNTAIALDPLGAKARLALAYLLRDVGETDAAYAAFDEAHRLGSSYASVAMTFLLPPVMGTRPALAESRAAFEARLDHLLSLPLAIVDPCAELSCLNFYLAYHGRNDLEVQRKTAQFYAQATPSLLFTAPHCAQPKPMGNRKIRVGFLSKFIYSHSVSASFSHIIKAMARLAAFDVTLISVHNMAATASHAVYGEFEGTHVGLPNDLEKARQAVADLQLDVLVYLDIGMEPLSYFMAFARLARVQCVLGGHPVTTGVANADYFLSSDLLEPLDADTHYSEKLVRMPLGVFYFARPTLPASNKPRSALGLPADQHIYLCPMKLQKIHPDFDEAISRILQLDAQGVVVLFDDALYPSWRVQLEQRFAQTIAPEVLARVVFLPWVHDADDFMRVNAAADVVLDPFHFGIGTTVIAIFGVGTPIVTKPGEFMRGRVGYGYCKLLGLPECIATDTESYAQIAVRIACNPDVRAALKGKILANNSVLFDNPQPIDDLVGFLLTVTAHTHT